MALTKLKDLAKNTFAAPLLAAALVTSAFPLAANAGDSCAPLEKTSYGMEWDASYSAHAYSEKHIGSIGISIFPGADLAKNGFTADEFGAAVVSVLKDANVDAECFVNSTMYESNGTALGFKIDGLSIKIDGDDSFNMAQVWNDNTVLKAAVSEAKTAKLLLGNRGVAPR